MDHASAEFFDILPTRLVRCLFGRLSWSPAFARQPVARAGLTIVRCISVSAHRVESYDGVAETDELVEELAGIVR